MAPRSYTRKRIKTDDTTVKNENKVVGILTKDHRLMDNAPPKSLYTPESRFENFRKSPENVNWHRGTRFGQ